MELRAGVLAGDGSGRSPGQRTVIEAILVLTGSIVNTSRSPSESIRLRECALLGSKGTAVNLDADHL